MKPNRSWTSPQSTVLVILILALLSYLGAAAQPAEGLLKASIKGDVAEIGKIFPIKVTVVPPEGVHLTTTGWTIDVTSDGAEFFGQPYPVQILTPISDKGSGAFPAEVHFQWEAPILETSTVGTRNLTVTFKGQWDDGTPAQLVWTGPVKVDFGDEWNENKIAQYFERRGLGLFLVAVFGFGLLMSLSPCIYPMIPITLAIIGARSQDKGPAHGLLLSVTYVIGMALVYAVLGALSALVFSGITAFMQSPYVLVPIALLMAALALSMFGAFELEAPAFLRDKLQSKGGGQRQNLAGVLAMGMVAGLVASPCVGPFLGALLAWVGTTGNIALGFLSLFTFGIGMGMLLIGVGTFPALLGSLPSSGGWMVTVRKGMGLLLLAMAFYFVRPGAVMPPRFFYPLLGVTTILVSIFLGAFDSVTSETHWWGKVRKGLGICVLIAGVLILLAGFTGQVKTLVQTISPMPQVMAENQLESSVQNSPPAVSANEASSSQGTPAKVDFAVVRTGEGVRNFLDRKGAEAKAAGKPMMIDFWANWCVYCKKLDKLVWHDPAVAAEAQRFVAVKVDATMPDDAEMEAVKEELGVPGLPRVVFIDSRGEILHGFSSGFQHPDKMLEVMQKIR